MQTNLQSFDYEQPLSILIGENGSGKSQALADVAEAYISRNYSVIAIANCPFDKFREQGKRYHFIGGRYGQSFISLALKTIIESIEEPSQSRYNVGLVLSYLGYEPRLGIAQEQKPGIVNWYELRGSHSSNDQRGVLPHIYLGKEKLHNWPAVFLRKNNNTIPLELASSGEIQLFTSLSFIASHITKNAVILIDEPENSLHPRWQRKYVSQLLDLFQSSEPKIVIATHAPIIVTEAPSYGSTYQVYGLSNNTLKKIDMDEKGMEAVLWEIFRVLTPRSAFLSRYMANLLHQIKEKEISLSTFDQAFEELLEAAQSDHKQRILIELVRMLAK